LAKQTLVIKSRVKAAGLLSVAIDGAAAESFGDLVSGGTNQERPFSSPYDRSISAGLVIIVKTSALVFLRRPFYNPAVCWYAATVIRWAV
jgi:hypothetical protein